MSKKILWVKLIALILVLISMIAVAIQFISYDTFSIGFNYGSTTQQVAQEFANITEIQVTSSADSVEVVRSNTQKDVLVTYYSNNKKADYYPTMNSDQNILKIHRNDISRFPFLFMGFNYNGRIVITVPDNMTIPYTISTVSGSVQLDAPSTDAIIKTTSGSIRVLDGGDNITAKSISGSIKIMKPFAKMDATTTSGSIKLSADNTSVDGVSAKSVSGSVKFFLPADCSYNFQYESISGSIRDDIRSPEPGSSGIITKTENPIYINAKTTSGSIRISGDSFE